jgi:hypothetical protein
MPGHRIMLELDRVEDERPVKVVQTYSSYIYPHKWVGWSYMQVPEAEARKFDAQNAGHRLSVGLYKLPIERVS